jgi:hypothetical protein
LSETLKLIQLLVAAADIRVSEHGYDELSNDGLTAREIINGVNAAILVEDYPDYPKGASVLVLQTGDNRQPVHVVWGIPKGKKSPAVLVTAYRPDALRWNATYTERKS